MTSPVICIGAAMVDELFFCQQVAIAATSNPAILQKSAGGVVSNIAQHIGLLQIPVLLLTVLGKDSDGEWLENVCKMRGVDTECFLKVNEPTGKYVSIIQPDGSLYTAVCADISGKYLTPQFLLSHNSFLQNASFIIGDTNITIEALNWLSEFCLQHTIKLIVEPVSVEKAKKLSLVNLSGIFMLTPNEDELPSLCLEEHNNTEKCIKELLQRGVEYVWLRKGKNGSEVYNKKGSIRLGTEDIQMLDSTGAGDAALAGWVAANHLGLSQMKCLQAGHSMAYEVLQVKGAIIESLSKKTFTQLIQKYYPDAE